MPLPPVVVELSPADAASELATVLVDACSESVADGDCELGGEQTQRTDARAVAIVSWPDARTGRIELGVRREPKVEWIVRDLRFEPKDPIAERWRTVGLVIGTLVGEAEANARADTKRPKRPLASTAPVASRPRPSQRPVEPSRSRSRAWLTSDALAGPALDDGSWRFGAGAGGGLETPLRPIDLGASVRYMLRPSSDALAIDWLTLSVGPLVRPVLAGALAGEIAVAGFVERLGASASSDGRSESGSRWISGARARLGLSFMLGTTWGVGLGAELEWRAGETTLRVVDRRVGQFPTLTYVLTAGMQFSGL